MTQTFSSNISKAYLFNFFANLHFIGGVVVPFFTDWGGLSFTQVMILQSWFMFWVFALEIPTGTVADRYGKKSSLLLACVFNAAAVIIYASVPNFYLFLLGEFLWAVSVALLSGASEAFIYDSLHEIGASEKSKKVLTRMESFKLAGIMVSGPIGSVMAAKFGLRAPMLFMVVPFVIALLIGLTFREPHTFKTTERLTYASILKDGVGFFIKSRVLIRLAVDMVFIGSIGYFMIWLYQPMLKKAGVDLAYFGLVGSAFVGTEIVIMNNYIGLEKLLGSKTRPIFFSAAMTGIMFVLGGLTNSVPFVILAILVGGGFGLSRRPLFISYMNKHIPPTQRATVLSTASMLEKLVLVLANPLIGCFVDWSLDGTLIILGGAALAFSVLSRLNEAYLID